MYQVPGTGAGRSYYYRVLLFLAFLCTTGSVNAEPAFDLSDYRGKVVIVDFWASWCVPCRRSFPWLNQMHEKYEADGLVIIGVNLDASPDDAQAFLHDYPAEFEIVFDHDGILARQFDVAAMPSSFVIDRNGEIVANHLGFKVKQQDEYERIIQEAVLSEKD